MHKIQLWLEISLDSDEGAQSAVSDLSSGFRAAGKGWDGRSDTEGKGRKWKERRKEEVTTEKRNGVLRKRRHGEASCSEFGLGLRDWIWTVTEELSRN